MRALLITFALTCCLIGPAPHTVIGSSHLIPIQARPFERVVHINPPGPNDSRYAYVPFDVPHGASRITVSYHYDRSNGANTIDIGLFDARSTGSEPESRGFRGWSGGRRAEFFVSRAEATPGYLPGAMPAGKWRVILGLYQVAPAGVDVSLKIQIETQARELQSSFSALGRNEIPTSESGKVSSNENGTAIASRRPTSTQSVRWWVGDLHMHTVHSDGDWTIPALIASARDSGLDFIVITDHNTASHHKEIDRLSQSSPQPLVLRGEEITTYGGHTNAWGLPSGTWIDFRAKPGDTSHISAIAAQAHRAGALISINHPFVLCGGCAWSYDAAARDFDAIEVWNGAWDFTDERALKMWDKILQSGRRITAIASSDSHRAANPIGKPSTYVESRDLSQRSVLSTIRQGRVYLTSEPKGPRVTFEGTTSNGRSRFGIGDEVRLRGPVTVRFFVKTDATPSDAAISLISNGQVVRTLPAGMGSQSQVIEIDCRSDSYFRLEVRDKTNAMLLLTNPIYVRVGQTAKPRAAGQ